MKKVMVVVAMVLFGYVGQSFAGGVTDNNNGNAGNIFVSTGENNGANSVGEWVDASDVPELKGDKGDKGDTGETGANGSDGQNGENGQNGSNGEQGVAGDKGDAGVNGDKGDKGEQGVQGEQGKGLENPVELQFEGVIKEGSRNAFSAYYIHDFNNDIDTVGLKWKHYFGTSYAEQVRRDLQKQIDELKGIQETVVPVGAEMYQEGHMIGIRVQK